MTNSINNFSADISINGQKLEEKTSFKYLGTTLCKNGTCSAEVHIRIASAITRLNRIWWCNTISFACNFKFYKSLVTSILLYNCKTWTLPVDCLCLLSPTIIERPVSVQLSIVHEFQKGTFDKSFPV